MTGRFLTAVMAGGVAMALSPLAAKVDLVTLPERDATQLTIYNTADLTLVRETRTLTLKKGVNRLEFGWAETLIDPTSVQLRAPGHEGEVRLLEVAYPPNIQGSAVWSIESKLDGAVPVEITFFTSGIGWRAFYMGTLSADESAMMLEGYVRVENHSGEDYPNAQTRVIVGKIHMVDQIAELARRTAPYGFPIPFPAPPGAPMTLAALEDRKKAYGEMARAAGKAHGAAEQKEIIKEGLSEYFLYTIEGTETIENGWGKRLPSFSTGGIPVKNLYRYEEERFGKDARRFLFFKNDEAHKLGKEPLPDGKVKVYRSLKEDSHLAYTGEVYAKYIPVGEEVELDLGAEREVKIEPVLMEEKTENYVFNANGLIAGWDVVQRWEVKLENNRALPISVEVTRNMPHGFWEIANSKENPGTFEKVDMDSAKYALDMKPNTKAVLAYTVRFFEGERREKK